jgi:diguanylate cyclase (GGDEF)-like protein
LQEDNAMVLVAHDGLEALDLALDRAPNVIFLSVDLARVDGVEVARALRALEPTDRIPIIFLAANESEAMQIKKEGLPFTECIVAPFPADEVRLWGRNAIRNGKGLAEMPRSENQSALYAINDPLTHVYQRRYVVHRLAYESARSARYKTPISVLLVDVDNLKKINAEHGISIGDAVLIETAEVLYKTLRRIDLIGRYDQQDFILVLPETNEESALVLANRLCHAIRIRNFLNGKLNLQITVSIGLAGGSGTDIAENLALIGRAATALDKAKQAGKNRVEIG